MPAVRTTVTLDPDVARMLNDQATRSRKSFKETLNTAVRLGLARASETKSTDAFVIEARPMGLRGGIDPARFNSLLDELEAGSFIEKSRQP